LNPCEDIRNVKSYNHLFEKLVSYENIEKAIYKSSIGKRDRPDIIKVLDNIEHHIKYVQDHLINRTFKIRKHTAHEINDGIRQKKRKIIKPDYLHEQILHHAVVQVMQDVIMKGMYVWSCGSIPERGGLYGKRYIEKFIKRNPAEIKYVVKADIKHFFENVDKRILKDLCRKKIHDEKMIWVLDLIIDSSVAVFDGEDMDFGLPIGYYTSQWFANWFLQDFDHFIKEHLKIKCYVRYVDDIVLFSRNKKNLHKAVKEIQKFFSEINLELKGNYQVFRFDYTDKDGVQKGRAVDFMGFKFYRNKTLFRKTILLKATRKALKLAKKKNHNWFECCQMLSYIGWFKHTDTYNVFETRIKPYVNIARCKKIVSLHQLKKNKEKQNDT